MSDLTRSEVIKHLEFLKLAGQINAKPEKINPDYLQFAIDSLNTDEAYQIEYENRDFIEIPEGATLGDMLLEILKGKEDCIYPVGNNEMAIKISVEQWNSPYRKEQE